MNYPKQRPKLFGQTSGPMEFVYAAVSVTPHPARTIRGLGVPPARR